MADQGEFRIKAVVDPTAAQAGLDEVSDAQDRVVRKTVESGEKAKEGGEKLDTAALSNLRSVHHLLGGLFELQAGGIAAIGGIAAEGRVATEVFEGMLGPLAPLALAISTIVMLAVPMFEKFEEHRQKVEGAKGGVDDYAAAWKAASEEITAGLKQVEDAQARIIANDDRDIALINSKASLTKVQATLDETHAEQELERKYIIAQQNKSLSDEDRKKLKADYEAAKQDLKNGGLVAEADNERDQKAELYGASIKKRDDTQQGIDDAAKTLKGLTETRDNAKLLLESIGVKSPSGPDIDKDDAFVVELKKRQAAVDKAQSDFDFGAKPQIDANDPERPFIPANTPAQQAALKAYVDAAQSKVDELFDAGKNVGLDASITAQQERIDKLKNDDLPKVVQAVKDAQVEVAQAGQKADEARTEQNNAKAQAKINDDLAAADLEQKQLREARDDELAARRKAHQKELDDANKAKDEGAKKRAQDEIDKDEQDAAGNAEFDALGNKLKATPGISPKDALTAGIETKGGVFPAPEQDTPVMAYVKKLEDRIALLEQQKVHNPDAVGQIDSQITGLRRNEEIAVDKEHQDAIRAATDALNNVAGNSQSASGEVAGLLTGLAKSSDKVAGFIGAITTVTADGLVKHGDQIAQLQAALEKLQNAVKSGRLRPNYN